MTIETTVHKGAALIFDDGTEYGHFEYTITRIPGPSTPFDDTYFFHTSRWVQTYHEPPRRWWQLWR